MFGKWRRQRALDRAVFPEDWIAYIANAVAQWPYLADDEREQLEDDTRYLVVEKHWEAARGFAITDEVRITIAAQAALLVLGLGDPDPYRNVGTIIVHATTVTFGGQHAGPGNTVSDAPEFLLGLAQFDGPVIVAWDEALANARHPERGHNVVYHEFAHKLDMLDGLVDGTPPLPTQEAVQRWAAVCTPEYESLRRGDNDPILNVYGGVNPGEFFAVVTEVFFDRPVALEARKPELYGVMRDFYNQDPAARVRARTDA
jgi:Mlc titration factor MtfA (ptsG expression regulator)